MTIIDVIEEKSILKKNSIRQAILKNDSQVRLFYDDATVFVTGGSGFIGKQLIEKLLRSCNIRKIYVLLRSRKGKNIDERLNQMLEDPIFISLRKEQPNFDDKLKPIEGDTTLENLGIDEKNWMLLTDEVNVILHSAATTNFKISFKSAILTNVRGTREMLKLGRESKHLKSIVHVSTAFAHATSGRIDKEVKEELYDVIISPDTLIQLTERMDENKLNILSDELLQEWPNRYVFTKAVAEELVVSMANQLPVCIVRPAVVVSAYQEPLPGWIDVKNVYGPSGLILGISHGVTHALHANKNTIVDFVPVDIVNNAIIVAAWDTFVRYSKNETKAKIFTITNKRNPLVWQNGSYIMNHETRDVMNPHAIWYCFILETRYKLLYSILTWILHYIPGLLIDGCCLLVGKKARYFEASKLLYKVSSAFSVYMNNLWVFDDSNTLELFNKLSSTDKEIYNFDMSSVDTKELLLTWSYGVLKYIGKVDYKKHNYGYKKQLLLKAVHYICFPLYLFMLYKIVYIVSMFFYRMLIMLSENFSMCSCN